MRDDALGVAAHACYLSHTTSPICLSVGLFAYLVSLAGRPKPCHRNGFGQIELRSASLKLRLISSQDSLRAISKVNRRDLVAWWGQGHVSRERDERLG
ncbi:hypothetical protein IQ07DRAFT_118986 [Pyrenochaeta sp. DS3sAY3a]|nr:hypothetical protein IQ07DRAFT_118986 [Pyrenochaeta sp. DS3sAY3a]